MIKYMVYTDGACNHQEGKIASSYFITTSKEFISMDKQSFKGTNNTMAESIAVGMAAQYLYNNMDLTKGPVTIEIKTDSQYVIDRFEGLSKNSNKRPYINNKWDRYTAHWLQELNSKCDWHFKKLKSHSTTINGNSVADRLVKYALRNSNI